MDIGEVISVYKPQGLTPVQLIEKLRTQRPELKDLKIGFAGRLDPLAHGVMLLTIEEANKNREPLLKLNKVYRFSVLFGIETDTYDYLGILKSSAVSEPPANLRTKIEQFIKNHTGKFSQPYPPFSSKTLNGIPLFKLAKRKKLKTEDLPLRDVEIFKFKLLSIGRMNSKTVSNQILQNLKKIKGYFRQTEIIKQWEEFFRLNPDFQFTLAHFEIECSSGTYVRSLANKMGEQFSCGAIAFEIFRTEVGKFKVENTIRIVT